MHFIVLLCTVFEMAIGIGALMKLNKLAISHYDEYLLFMNVFTDVYINASIQEFKNDVIQD